MLNVYRAWLGLPDDVFIRLYCSLHPRSKFECGPRLKLRARVNSEIQIKRNLYIDGRSLKRAQIANFSLAMQFSFQSSWIESGAGADLFWLESLSRKLQAAPALAQYSRSNRFFYLLCFEKILNNLFLSWIMEFFYINFQV